MSEQALGKNGYLVQIEYTSKGKGGVKARTFSGMLQVNGRDIQFRNEDVARNIALAAFKTLHYDTNIEHQDAYVVDSSREIIGAVTENGYEECIS